MSDVFEVGPTEALSHKVSRRAGWPASLSIPNHSDYANAEITHVCTYYLDIACISQLLGSQQRSYGGLTPTFASTPGCTMQKLYSHKRRYDAK